MIGVTDRFGRPVTQARISVNSSMDCNFACSFCHREGISSPSDSLITPEEIERVVRVMARFGVDRVKLTGGEPMLRRDICEIVERIKSVGLKELSMSTNGTLLVRRAAELRQKGLDRVNISLHSIQRERFALMTGCDRLGGTLAAVQAAIDAKLLPVKLNVTLMRGINEDEVEDLLEFSRSVGGGVTNILQLIELVPTYDGAEFYRTYHASLDSVEDYLKRVAVNSTERVLHRRPRYHLPNGVTVEIVRPMHNTEFCLGCNRIRITYDGKFKPCLLREDNHIDFLKAMRSGADERELSQLFLKAVSEREPFFKPEVATQPSGQSNLSSSPRSLDV